MRAAESIQWTDHHGKSWRVSQSRHRLSFTKIRHHRALRAFVYHRADYRCQQCGRMTAYVSGVREGDAACFRDPFEYLAIDHVVPMAAGGGHHPANLQALCDSCNAAKAASDRRLASRAR